MTTETLLSRLDRVKETGPDLWMACSPSHIVEVGKDWIRQGKLISNRGMKVYLEALRLTEDTSHLDRKLVELIEYRIKQGIRISEVNKRECVAAMERLESGDYYIG
jgi:hypothetical protein